jgi:ribosomal protein S18 acetylase RimI-like enzyme
MTDVLGVCLRWSAGECVVQPDDGPAVTIPLRLVVSGKPVPPRPSVRARATPLEIHRHVAGLWPGVVTEQVGEWVLRAGPLVDGRHPRRGSSALAMGDPGVPVPEALDRVLAFSARHGRRPLAVVELGSEREDELAALGWTPIDLAPVHTQLASVARVRRGLGPAVGDASVEEDGPRVEVRLGDWARGRAAVEGDWLGLHGVVVDAEHRRRGLARAVVAALLEWGAERGATTAWLHVESDNVAAVRLWEGLGFRTHHDHRYVAPDLTGSGPAPAS